MMDGKRNAAAADRRSVAAVIPCTDRPDDLRALLGDLARCDAPVELRVIVVDNASQPPIEAARVDVIRLHDNRGGSGGFNAGMTHALGGDSPEFVWLLDSDVRVEPGTLSALIGALDDDPSLAAAGPSIADPATRVIHECGGRVDRRTGVFRPEKLNTASSAHVCDYAASCCLLVRADAVRRVGLMPDRFLNGDDVEWCIRLGRDGGGAVAATPRALAYHPRFSRIPGTARYYHARNAYGAINALGLGAMVRARRALVEIGRAMNQALSGRRDLARLHIEGLADAARGLTTGPSPKREIPGDSPRRLSTAREAGEYLAATADEVVVEERLPGMGIWDAMIGTVTALGARARTARGARRASAIFGAAARALGLGRAPAAAVSAAGGPGAWFLARRMALVSESAIEGVAPSWGACAREAVRCAVHGVHHAIVIALRRGVVEPLSPAPAPSGMPVMALSAVVLSHNRRAALRETLTRLERMRSVGVNETVVIDNASSDGSAEMVERDFPGAVVVRLTTNIGVAGFNAGVWRARGTAVLILDDDARPCPAHLAEAMSLLERRPDLAAVTFLPVHPATGRSEWPFGDAQNGARDDWPTMGCANLVRREDWLRSGGYDASLFLYRNDTDLAMKLLGSGRGVHFNPAWFAWHDSPGARRKPARWFELATRNWIWLARRHGRGLTRGVGAAAGWAWAHRLAGFEAALHLRVIRGVIRGMWSRPSTISARIRPDGRAFASMLALHARRGMREDPSRASGRRDAPVQPETVNAPSMARHSA